MSRPVWRRIESAPKDGTEIVAKGFDCGNTSGAMTDAEKIEAFDKLRDWLWDAARFGNTFQSTVAAAILRQFNISSKDGEDAEGT